MAIPTHMTRPNVHMKAAELVADQIRAAIASGELTAGERLPAQPELAKLYDVSAPTLREALRILETDGLVRVRRGVKGGTIVNAPNLAAMSRQLGLYLQMHSATIADLYAARIVLEPPAVRLLAARFTPEIHAELLEAIDEEQREAHADTQAVAGPAARLHTLLLQRCGNVTFAALGGVVGSVFEQHIATAVRSTMGKGDLAELADASISRQRKLLDLLTAGDGAAAERHWRRTLEGQLELLQQRGSAGVAVEFY